MGAREEVGELAYRLRYGLYAHTATQQIARELRTAALAPMAGPIPDQVSREVACKDGSTRPFLWGYALEQVDSDPTLQQLMDQAWCISSLIILGDRLAGEEYFDRAPVLEMVRHLRNGVAHGNRFTLRSRAELERWPAHTRDAACRLGEPFEITMGLDGRPVLFDFMAAGDVLDLLISVGTYLLRAK